MTPQKADETPRKKLDGRMSTPDIDRVVRMLGITMLTMCTCTKRRL
jgi:hypothetical protein